MDNQIDRFIPGGPGALDPDVNLALRALAGWPMQTAAMRAHRERDRVVTIHRDAAGNVIGSTETVYEREVEDINQTWGK